MMIVVKLASDSNLSKPFIPSPPLASAAMVTPTTTTSTGGNPVGGRVGATPDVTLAPDTTLTPS